MLPIFNFLRKKPKVSIVIVSYNMAREVPRTVSSFLQGYQYGIQQSDIEILVMENGSNHPIPLEIVRSWPENVRYISLENAKPSPAYALNEGVRLAKADIVCPVIDGARMVTPGVVIAAIAQMRSHKNPIVTTIGYHLGDEVQQLAVKRGYNQQVEDELLAKINWPNNPYKLYDISSLGGSARHSWLGGLNESNVLFLKKSFYQDIGGYDEGFDIPGGGLVNLDFFNRSIGHAESQYILLVGEGSFHQFHGGVTTSRSVGDPSTVDAARSTWQVYVEQYEKIRGYPYTKPSALPILYGEFRVEAKKEIISVALDMIKL